MFFSLSVVKSKVLFDSYSFRELANSLTYTGIKCIIRCCATDVK